MENTILKRIQEHKKTIEKLSDSKDVIKKIAEAIVLCYKNKGKVVFFGNGGSSSDSQHLATEFVSRYYINRKSLPAIALTDSVSLSAIGNDYHFDEVFAKQVEGHVNEGDVVIGITTSGNSRNVINAVQKAKEIGAFTVVFTGMVGGDIGKLKEQVDICLNIPSKDTPRIQEGYMLAGHIICELVEKELFGKSK